MLGFVPFPNRPEAHRTWGSQHRVWCPMTRAGGLGGKGPGGGDTAQQEGSPPADVEEAGSQESQPIYRPDLGQTLSSMKPLDDGYLREPLLEACTPTDASQVVEPGRCTVDTWVPC